MSLLTNRVKTAAAVVAISLALPAVSYAQAVAGGDPGTILTSAVTFLEGPFGVAVASIIVVIIAILLAIGRHTYEGILLALMAIALYFGGPGLVAKITGGG